MEQVAVVKTSNISKSKKAKVLYFSSFYFIAGVLLFPGISKIFDPIPLINTLKIITIIPGSSHVLIVTLLPVVEIALAILMMTNIKPGITLTAVTILFTIFLGFSIYGKAAGFGSDCGCFGNTIKSSFGWGMIIRNAVFLIISLILTINAWPGRISNK